VSFEVLHTMLHKNEAAILHAQHRVPLLPFVSFDVLHTVQHKEAELLHAQHRVAAVTIDLLTSVWPW